MKAKNVAIIGSGHVGLVTGACLAEMGHNVICVDNDASKINLLQSGRCPFYEPGLDNLVEKHRRDCLSFTTDLAEAVKKSEVIFIAVSTPPKPDGKTDLSYVANAARQIANYIDSYKLVVDKSTVPVNTGYKVEEILKNYSPAGSEFDVASNPEFLREGSAVRDFLYPDRIVIGVNNKRSEKMLRELYQPVDARIIVTDIKSAELIKHASNSFLAAKVSFINGVAEVCERCGADVEKVALGMGLDERIGGQFLKAGIGYGGSCFPKDVDAFIAIADELGYNFQLLKAVRRINKEALDRFIEKISNVLWVIKDKKVVVLGLAFKPNTSDVRNAPAIEIVKFLRREGAEVWGYDPKAANEAARLFKNMGMQSVNPDLITTDRKTELVLFDANFILPKAFKNADAIIIATDWQEFKSLNWLEIKNLMRSPIVLDGRNMLEPDYMRQLGFHYFSIGR